MNTFRIAAALWCVAQVALVAQDDKAKVAEAVETARKAYDAGRYEEADRAFDAVALPALESFDAMLLRARIGYALGEWGKASTYADNAAKLDPSNVDAWMLAGQARFMGGEEAKLDGRSTVGRISGFYEQAIDAFDKALALKPGDAKAAEILDWKGHAAFWSDEVSKTEGRLKDSADAFEAAVKLDPEAGDSWWALARTEFKRQNKARALEAITKGLAAKRTSDSTGPLLAQMLSDVYVPEKKFEEAVAAMKGWAAAQPRNPAPYVWSGFFRTKQGRDDEAIPLFVKAWEISEKTAADAAYELGQAYLRKGDEAKAVEAFTNAWKARREGWNFGVSPVDLIVDVGARKFLEGKHAEGIAFIEKHALPIAADDWRVHNSLGLFYRDWPDRKTRKEHDAKALQHYAKAAELVVKVPDEQLSRNWKSRVINDLGVIHHFHYGDVDKGLAKYREALEWDPTWVDALENAGLCLNKLGKYEEARALFKKVLEIEEPDPNNPGKTHRPWAGRRVTLQGLAEAEKNLKK
ncbi:MAG TPA: tetratricopeptide repeat protein [Planctomycetota bacterium]|nr:tetratricopeptide repeat protein [Planctomycetota bacterium]